MDYTSSHGSTGRHSGRRPSFSATRGEGSHGCSAGSRQTEADRRLGTGGTPTTTTPPSALCASAWGQSSDVNAAKHNGRQTDVHTSPNGAQRCLSRRTEGVKGGQGGGAGAGRQLVNAADNRMDEPIL